VTATKSKLCGFFEQIFYRQDVLIPNKQHHSEELLKLIDNQNEQYRVPKQ